MPKLKTKSSIKKRFKITASGKLKFKHSNARHILTKKTTKRKRHLRGTGVLSKADTKRIKSCLHG